MRVFIAEKPSLARAISDELGITKKGQGFIECGGDVVTWCFGHMLEMASPDEYTPDDVPTTSKGNKIWRIDELPIIPQNWIYTPRKDAMAQIKIIGGFVKKADQIINAGDPDREGNLLVDELLTHFKNTKPVLRYWANANDSASVSKALKNMKPNSEYMGMSLAAQGRGKADWLTGMNLSRAFTLGAQRAGYRVLLSYGRVQSPTLKIVVDRDRQIESFKPVPFHTIRAEIQHENGSFLASWNAKDDQGGLDSEGRLIDTAIADKLINSLTGCGGRIKNFEQKSKKQNQPLTFSLSSLQILASKKFGYSAQEVLDIAQALYEKHKMTTYPRTDTAYLKESQHSEAPEILAVLKNVYPDVANLIDGADPLIKSKTWNDKKLEAHHGIIPTLQNTSIDKLNEKESNLYDLIVRAYIAQFYPSYEYMSTIAQIDINEQSFIAKGNVTTSKGWKNVYVDPDDEKTNNSQSLPSMQIGDAVTTAKLQRKDQKTKPPARFTEGSLIDAMVNIHKFASDNEYKSELKEGDGIGTEATRASILSELKRKGFLESKNKNIISSELGRSLIDALPDIVKSPELTALNERELKEVELGNASIDHFLAKQVDFVTNLVNKVNKETIEVKGVETKPQYKPSLKYKCTECGSALVRRPAKKKGVYWWACSNFPTCKQTYFDKNRAPVFKK